MSSDLSRLLPSHWTNLLDQVQQALSLAEAEATRALDRASLPEPVSGPGQVELPQKPDRQLLAATAEADLIAAEVESIIQTSEAALKEWRGQVQKVGGKLAKLGKPGV
jgi:hypothetical protein